MKYLITGGCGFIGSNIACEILKTSDELLVFDNLYRHGSERNLRWLRGLGHFRFIHGDIRNREDVESLVKDEKPDVILHLAGQVAMTTSIRNPRMDFEVNVIGSFNLLDSVRRYSPNSVILYSSTNKVYGDLEWTEYTADRKALCYAILFPNGFPQSIPLDFHSPYGTSKGSADQYMLDFHRIFCVRSIVFRHSSIYGGRQFATYDTGWLVWFCQQAIAQKDGRLKQPFTISGNESSSVICYTLMIWWRCT